MTDGIEKEAARPRRELATNARPERSAAPRPFALEPVMLLDAAATEQLHVPRAGFDDESEQNDGIARIGNVAIVSIYGPLMQRASWWWDGYDAIRARFEAALADPDVVAVVLRIASPGGVCAGCFSTARAMREAKAASDKPVFAFADEGAYSAAYALACVADQIYVPKEGGVGSVGVIATIQDLTGYMANAGVKVTVVASGEQKADGHPFVPISDDVVKRYQSRIDSLASSFAELVSEARDMTPAKVLGLEAACLYGQDAVTAGLADGVQSFDDTIALATAAAAKRSVVASQTAQSVLRTIVVQRR